MEYSSHSLLSFQIGQIIDLLHEMFLTFLENDLDKILGEFLGLY